MDFSIADPQTPKRCIEALNDSFDSIKDMINNYEPKTTVQDYAILYYVGPIKAETKIYTETPSEAAIPIFAQYYGGLKYVGDLVERTLTFVETLSDENNNNKEFVIYQPYRISIVADKIGLNKEMFYRNPEEDIHQ